MLLFLSLLFPSAPPPDSARAWYAPRYAVAQFAGGIGMASAGLGYRWRAWEGEALLGYVPRRAAGIPLGIGTLKFRYVPLRVPLRSPAWQLHPLSVGALVNYTAGNLADTRTDKYPPGYYWWSARVRTGLFLGGQVRYTQRSGRNVVAYYEAGTNDLYLVSLFGNLRGGLPLGQVLTLGVGLKIDLGRSGAWQARLD